MLSPEQIFGSTFLAPEGKCLPKHVEQWDHPRDRREYSVEIHTFKVTDLGEGGGFNCSIRTIFHIRDNRRMKVVQ
jgi:siderophore synthetase component